MMRNCDKSTPKNECFFSQQFVQLSYLDSVPVPLYWYQKLIMII